MNERIKLLRLKLNLNQLEFANKIGLTTSAISGYESGRRIPNEAVIKLICREFNVDYFWLTEGKGEMFLETPDDIIDQVVDEYGLNEKAKIIIKAYVQMNDDQRECVEDFFMRIAEELKKSE